MSRLPPTTIMLEVYRVLKAAEFVRRRPRRRPSHASRLSFVRARAAQRWKSSSIFSVQVVPSLVRSRVADDVASQCMRGDVRLSLQLYKVSQTKHLLDIKKIAGAQFEFFDACVALIESLQI